MRPVDEIAPKGRRHASGIFRVAVRMEHDIHVLPVVKVIFIDGCDIASLAVGVSAEVVGVHSGWRPLPLVVSVPDRVDRAGLEPVDRNANCPEPWHPGLKRLYRNLA